MNTAEQIVSKLEDMRPRVWRRGDRVRVYLRYPQGYEGSAGGGELGFVDLSGDKPRYGGGFPADLLQRVKDAVGHERQE